MNSHIKPPIKVPSRHLRRININKLRGRLLYLPAKKQTKYPKKIVMLAGQHAAHERLYAVAQVLNDYGEVYSPDLPGFGGMTSFYKIGKQPTYDNYADYLYTFLKANRLTEDVWFFSWSFGAQVMTRMFQKYPHTQQWVKTPIAFVGFARGSDFNVSRWYKTWLFALIYPASTKWGARLLQAVAFNKFTIKFVMTIFSLTKAKMQNDNGNLRRDMKKMEEYLWTVNDRRTHAATAVMMFHSDLTRYSDDKIDLKLHNIITDSDQYFDNRRVKASFEKIYMGYKAYGIDLRVHTPSMIADKQEVQDMLSEEVIKLLSAKDV